MQAGAGARVAAARPAAPKIRIRNLHKYFTDLRAIEDVSIDIAEGTFFTIVGPS
jgi:ABC-type Fe3+/spermidine/putrescine transport system ATPase subunit